MWEGDLPQRAQRAERGSGECWGELPFDRLRANGWTYRRGTGSAEVVERGRSLEELPFDRLRANGGDEGGEFVGVRRSLGLRARTLDSERSVAK